MSDGLAIVGQRAVKLDAAAKATGRARYVSDLLLPRLLHARLLRSPHPHARVLRVDASAALHYSPVATGRFGSVIHSDQEPA